MPRRVARWIIVLGLLGGYWLLPIRGAIFVGDAPPPGAWPQIWTEPAAPRHGEAVTVYVRDGAPWADVALMVGRRMARRDEGYPTGGAPWTWRWRTTFAADSPIIFYHSCSTGCVEHGRASPAAAQPAPAPALRPTKLGAVFANPARDWHGRAAWTVDLTYSQLADQADWGIDSLAERVAAAESSGLRILVRVAYDQGQSLPPAGDEVAASQYLAYCARLARDDRLRGVYGYIIGGGFNSASEQAQAPDRPATPEWVARLLVGYGLPADRSDNAVQRMHAVRPAARVLVGPVRPWINDQDGALAAVPAAPWLNYFTTLVARIDAAVGEKNAAGIALAAPDGFALNAFGRPEAAPEPDAEPGLDLRRPEWGDAQAGFRVYRDWLAIINLYPATRGLPAFISAANTYTADIGAVPLQNYPAGWMTAALAEINREPQVQALCWFVDLPFGETWQEWSLARPQGNLFDAAAEFDRLLQQ